VLSNVKLISLAAAAKRFDQEALCFGAVDEKPAALVLESGGLRRRMALSLHDPIGRKR